MVYPDDRQAELTNMAHIYCSLLGRKLFGPQMKYPLYRLGRYPEWFLRGKLYLDFSDGQPPRSRVPEHVPIPEEAGGPCWIRTSDQRIMSPLL